jgi:hypothetical protein
VVRGVVGRARPFFAALWPHTMVHHNVLSLLSLEQIQRSRCGVKKGDGGVASGSGACRFSSQVDIPPQGRTFDAPCAASRSVHLPHGDSSRLDHLLEPLTLGQALCPIRGVLGPQTNLDNECPLHGRQSRGGSEGGEVEWGEMVLDRPTKEELLPLNQRATPCSPPDGVETPRGNKGKDGGPRTEVRQPEARRGILSKLAVHPLTRGGRGRRAIRAPSRSACC